MNVTQLASRIRSDPHLAQEIQQDPVKALERYSTPLDTDVWIYRIVVLALGITVLAAIGGAIYLAATGTTKTPEILVALGSAAVGALAGLLAPAPGGK